MVRMPTITHPFTQPLRLEPQYRDYVWGGRALRPNVPGPTAEMWMIYEHNRVSHGPFAGKTLAELAGAYPPALIGERHTGEATRFPLLVKLLDCADWLSVQVHPNDELARELEGPQNNGKTEAWHVLRAEPGANIVCGLNPGISYADFSQAVRSGGVTQTLRRLDMRAGDTVLIRAGTIHALGPGMMIYEVQQTSDITYRVYDWDRPASAARPLHIDKSLRVTDPSLRPELVHLPDLVPGEHTLLAQSEYFRLTRVTLGSQPLDADTRGRTFHALTALDATVTISGADWQIDLEKWQSLLIPAALGAYQLQAADSAHLLCASLPV